MHSYNPHSSYSPANTSASSSPLHMVSAATSVTTMTTTTTTAVIGSGSTYTQRERKRPGIEAFENGILEIKPLVNGSGTYDKAMNGIELESLKRYTFSNGQNPGGIEHCPLHQTMSSTPRHKSKRKANTSCHKNGNKNLESSSSCSSEESSPKLASSVKSCHVNENKEPHIKSSFGPEYRNTEYFTPSPDFSTQSSTHQSSASPSPPLCNYSQSSGSSSSPAREAATAEIESLPVVSLTSWCPQHNPRSIPFHLWAQTSVSNGSHCSSTCKSTNVNVTPFHRLCGRASISHRDSLHANDLHGQVGSSVDPKKLFGSREEALIGKPFLKMSSNAAAKSQYGMMPQGPVMMMPWYQYSPTVNPSWFPCPPFVTFLPPSHCSYHPPSASAHSQSHFFTHHSPSSPVEEAGLSHLSSLTVPQPPSSVPQTQTCSSVTSLPSNTSVGGSLNAKGSSASWWLNRATAAAVGSLPSTNRSSETCMVPIERGAQTSEVGDFSCYNNPIMRGSLPFLGEPVRCFQRLTQLPDDRCALLPISPPLTPHQFEYDSNSVSTLTTQD